MKTSKFDEIDREKVVSEIEKYFKINLTRFGRRKKYLSDQNGKSYWVLGGYDNWHGIPPDMLSEEKRKSTNGVLVVAKRYTSKIDIFVGSLQKLIDNEKSLCHTQDGDYQFNVTTRNDCLLVKEIDGLVLMKLGGSAYSQEEKAQDSNNIKTKTIIRRLSVDEKKQLVEEILKSDT
jgi:hypothetical protein